MADTNTDGGEGGNSAPSVEEGTKSPLPKAQETPASGADDGEEGEEGADDGEEEEEPAPEDDGTEPPVRRDPSYFVGLRKGKKAARQQQRKEDKGDEGEDDDSDDEEDVEKVVEKAIKPLAERIFGQEDKNELENFMLKNPLFKPYEAKIKRFAKHESRAHLPIATIAMEAVGPEGMMKLGAKLARSADTKKLQSKGGGGGGRSPQAKTDVWTLPQADFTEMQNKVRHGGR
jgi:hypothetical protein